LSIKSAKKGDLLIFAENFDKNWTAVNRNNGYKISSTKYGNSFNSFVLTEDGNYSFDIIYQPQIFVSIGIVISAVSLALIICAVTYIKFKK
jgi:hypothetical protein